MLILAIALLAARADPPKPPPEAYTACQSKAAGDKCGDSRVSGTCAMAGDALACRPEGHQHHGPPPEAFEACAAKSEGAACSVTLPDNSLKSGVCKRGPAGNEKLACVL
jgi:hypothetical protein